MRVHLRAFVLAVSASLVVGVLAAPVAAVVEEEPGPVVGPERRASVTLLNGKPGAVDVCVGRSEVASGLRFTRWTGTKVDAGVVKVRFFQARAGACKGRAIAVRRLTLKGGEDLTLVLKLGRPRVVVFENGRDLDSVLGSPDRHAAALRHAARARDVDFEPGCWHAGATLTRVGPDPKNAGDHVYVCGADEDMEFGFRATRLRDQAELVKERVQDLRVGHRYEIYLVGWNRASYRFVVVKRKSGPARIEPAGATE